MNRKSNLEYLQAMINEQRGEIRRLRSLLRKIATGDVTLYPEHAPQGLALNPLNLYEAAAFYRSAALSGETVTGHEYDAAFDYWDDTDFSNVNPDDYYGDI